MAALKFSPAALGSQQLLDELILTFFHARQVREKKNKEEAARYMERSNRLAHYGAGTGSIGVGYVGGDGGAGAASCC